MLLGVVVCYSTAYATDYNVTSSDEGTTAFDTQYADGLPLNSGDALGLNLSQTHNTRTFDYSPAAMLTPNITLDGGRISQSDSVWYLSGTTTVNGNYPIVGSNAKFISLAKLEGSGTLTGTKNNGDGSAARALQPIGDNSAFSGTIELVNNSSTGTNYVVVSHEKAVINAAVVLTDNSKTNATALNVASASVTRVSQRLKKPELVEITIPGNKKRVGS